MIAQGLANRECLYRLKKENNLPLCCQFGGIVFALLATCAPMASCLRFRTANPQDDEVSREIVDPCLGSRWQLHVDSSHPGWPGRLVLLDSAAGHSGDAAGQSAYRSYAMADGIHRAGASGNDFPNLTLPLAIRVGEQITVEQDSEVLHARFQAIALESARVGQGMRVRLSAGTTVPLSMKGTVISVIATGMGRAKWTGIKP
jgi:hypothetical protein